MNNKETIEEAAEKIYPNDGYENELYCDIGEVYREKFVEGAKWQQEQDKYSYSEEEAVKLIDDITKNYDLIYKGTIKSQLVSQFINSKTIFEQFKKK